MGAGVAGGGIVSALLIVVARRWLVNAYALDSFEREGLGTAPATDADVRAACLYYSGPQMNPWPETVAVMDALWPRVAVTR